MQLTLLFSSKWLIFVAMDLHLEFEILSLATLLEDIMFSSFMISYLFCHLHSALIYLVFRSEAKV